jgi:hypothetical protein
MITRLFALVAILIVGCKGGLSNKEPALPKEGWTPKDDRPRAGLFVMAIAISMLVPSCGTIRERPLDPIDQACAKIVEALKPPAE